MNPLIQSAVASVCHQRLLAGLALVLAGSAQANLLINGDFNLDADANGKPDGWTSWAWSNDTSFSSFSDYKATTGPDAFSFDGTPYVNAGTWGAWWSGGAGWFQNVGGSENKAYSITAFSGSEGWDNAAGEIRVIYLDGSGNTIRQDVQHTIDYTSGKPWAPYVLSSVAPAGTVSVKTEFATWGARGAVMWDNANLVEASIWNLPVGGDYLTGTNWTNGVPNGVDASAQFNASTSADEVITLDDAVILGTLGFRNSSTYQLAGAGSIKMQSSAGDALIVDQQGAHRINVPLTIASNTGISANDSSWLRISKPVTVNSGATLTTYGVGSIAIESSVTLQDNAALILQSSMHPTALTLGNGATASVKARGSGAIRVLTVSSLSSTASSRVDINDNALVVDYDSVSPLAGVRSALRSAYADGAWTGAGVTSGKAAANATDTAAIVKMGLIYGEVSSLPSTATSDLALSDNTAVVVRYGAMADANFDGMVSSTDFDALIGGYGKVANAGWVEGDFDYDGKVTTSDFNVLAGNFGANINPATAPLGNVVPEPASLGFAAIGGLLAMRRRR